MPTSAPVTAPTAPDTRGVQPRRHPGRLIAASMVTLIGVVLAAMSLVGGDPVVEERVFEGPVEEIIVDVSGSVSITAGDTSELVVTRDWFLLDAPRPEVSYENRVARVEGGCRWYMRGCSTDVAATVPAGAQVLVTTVAGSVTVFGTTGGVDVTTTAGSVQVEDVAGGVRIETTAGRIHGSVRGDIDAETSAGAIDLTVSGSFRRVGAVSNLGAVDITVPDVPYRVDADTSIGSVTVGVRTDPESDTEIYAHSSMGNVTVNADRR